MSAAATKPPPPANHSQHIDAREVGRRLGVGYNTVLSWGRRGIIPRHKPLVGNRVLFVFEEVVRALKARGREEVRHAT